jgi:hypothetical protein
VNGGSRRTATADRSTAPAGTATAGTGTDTAVRTTVAPTTGGVSADQVITLAAFVAVAVIALVFDKNIGFTAISAAVLLTALFPKAQKGAVSPVSAPSPRSSRPPEPRSTSAGGPPAWAPQPSGR